MTALTPPDAEPKPRDYSFRRLSGDPADYPDDDRPVLLLIHYETARASFKTWVRAEWVRRFAREDTSDGFDGQARDYCEETEQQCWPENWYEAPFGVGYEEMQWAVNETAVGWMELPPIPEEAAPAPANQWRYTVATGAEYPQRGVLCDISVRGYADAPSPLVLQGTWAQPIRRWHTLDRDILPGFPEPSQGCGHVYAWRYAEIKEPAPNA